MIIALRPLISRPFPADLYFKTLYNLAEYLHSKLEHLVKAEQQRLQEIRDLGSKVCSMEEDCAAPIEECHHLVLEDLGKDKQSQIRKEISAVNRERNEAVNKRDEFETDLRQRIDVSAMLGRRIEDVERR